jgi:hypothetical protein
MVTVRVLSLKNKVAKHFSRLVEVFFGYYLAIPGPVLIV